MSAPTSHPRATSTQEVASSATRSTATSGSTRTGGDASRRRISSSVGTLPAGAGSGPRLRDARGGGGPTGGAALGRPASIPRRHRRRPATRLAAEHPVGHCWRAPGDNVGPPPTCACCAPSTWAGRRSRWIACGRCSPAGLRRTSPPISRAATCCSPPRRAEPWTTAAPSSSGSPRRSESTSTPCSDPGLELAQVVSANPFVGQGADPPSSTSRSWRGRRSRPRRAPRGAQCRP